VPVLEGVVAWIAGAVGELLEGGDHVIALAEAIAAGAPGGDPLVFHRGGFRRLGD
jgi:flavin reductase (DIM6/NTAB) family NADH-FMN oxidoreductase RutF